MLSANLNLLTSVASGSFTFGYVIQTISVGTMTDAIGFQAWICAMKVKTTALGAGTTVFATALAVRDSTVMANPDLTKLKQLATILAYSGTISQTSPGTKYNSVESQVLSYSPGGGVQGIDDYGNTISAGDTLVADFIALVTSGVSGFVGTFDAIVWFTSMIAP